MVKNILIGVLAITAIWVSAYTLLTRQPIVCKLNNINYQFYNQGNSDELKAKTGGVQASSRALT